MRDLLILRDVDLSKTKIGDAGMLLLARLKGLNYLDVGQTKIGDVGVRAIFERGIIKFLGVDDTLVTDAALDSAWRAENLWGLSLCRTSIGDIGITHLKRLSNDLFLLYLDRTLVTDSGIVSLVKSVRVDVMMVNGTAITPMMKTRLHNEFRVTLR